MAEGGHVNFAPIVCRREMGLDFTSVRRWRNITRLLAADGASR